jgi:ATP-binding protein involved in chromosome partitioning
MVTAEDVKKAMSTVQEPELGRDLVALDMVKDVRIDGGKVSVTVELTTPACPLKEKIERECHAALKAIPGVAETAVSLTHRVLKQKPVPDKESIPGIKNVIAVYACKGGVGKSTVAVNLAAALKLDGASVGIFDADIYGPNVPLMMGAAGNPEGDGEKIQPMSAHGVKLMSMGFLTTESTPMIWRGLTLIQSVPLAGVVIVTTPQDVALLDGVKGIQMFRKLGVPVLGLVENMSGFTCPHCQHETAIFSKGGGEREAERLKIPFLGAVPLDPSMVTAGDTGVPIVLSHPKSAQAKALRWMAQVTAGQISVANMGLSYSGSPAPATA